jgi:5-deoxy-glucuronate isomerase
VSVEVRGDGVTERTVRHLLEGADDADSLLLVEVVTPGGHWSSFPPHKHDTPSSSETWLEELYYFRVRPEDTWALQYVYRTQDDGEALAVYDGDLVMVPRGYHPVSAPPGTDVYYLNVMAGPERVWRFSVDPAFSHVPGFSPPPIRG